MTNMTKPAGEQRRAAAPIQVLIAIFTLSAGAVLTTYLNRSGHAGPEQYLIFPRLFFFNDHVEAVAMLIGFVVALRFHAIQTGIIRLAAWIGLHPRTVCGLSFIVLAAGSRFVYLAHPLSMDEYVPVMQAHAFARGELTAHYAVPLLDELVFPAFRGSFILLNSATGAAMSGYWPGLALLMTPFVLIHAIWAFNATLSVLALALIGSFAARASTTSEQAHLRRGWAMLAALASPAFTVNAMSFYAMPALLAFNLLFLWLLLKPSRLWAFSAGIVGGLALVLHNPVPHAMMAIPCLAWMAAERTRRTRLPALIAGYLPPALILGLGWLMLNSALGMTGAVATKSQEGFVTHWTQLIGHIFHLPSMDTMQARQYATWKVWIWACPGLAFAPFVIRPRDTALKLLVSAFVLTYLIYFLVSFDQGHGWGYRYVQPAWGVFPIAGGIWFARQGARNTLGAIVVAAGLLATPAFLWETHATIASFLARRIEPPVEGRWVVFVDTAPRYSADLVQNPPGIGRVIYFVSHGEDKDGQLMAAQFPGSIRTQHDSRGSAWHLPDSASLVEGPIRPD